MSGDRCRELYSQLSSDSTLLSYKLSNSTRSRISDTLCKDLKGGKKHSFSVLCFTCNADDCRTLPKIRWWVTIDERWWDSEAGRVRKSISVRDAVLGSFEHWAMKEVRDTCYTQRQKSIVNSHNFWTLLWLLKREAADPAATRCLFQAPCSEVVNRMFCLRTVDHEPGAEGYRSGLSPSGATFADSLCFSSFSVQVERQ